MKWKSIGILANTVEGAADCYRKIVQGAASYTQDFSHPEIVLHQISFSIYKRAMEEFAAGKPKFLIQTLCESAETLRRAGVEFLIIPANTPHLVYTDFSKSFAFPSLSIIDAVNHECEQKKFFRPLVLGTYWTMKYRLYSQYSEIRFQYPMEEDLLEVHQLIMQELLNGVITSLSRNKIYRIVDKYKKSQGCDSVVLGCTELPLIFEKNSPLPFVDSNQALVQKALSHAFQDDCSF